MNGALQIREELEALFKEHCLVVPPRVVQQLVHLVVRTRNDAAAGKSYASQPVPREDSLLPAAHIAEEVFLERRRQIRVEGYTPDRDDERYGMDLSKAGDLAIAAGVYASVSGALVSSQMALPSCFRPKNWPWARETFKPAPPRRMLVKAAALILAQVEMLDRWRELDDDAPPASPSPQGGGQ